MVALGLFNNGRWRVISWVSSTNAFLGVPMEVLGWKCLEVIEDC